MISVVMAAYKGEKYIRQQLESILTQLSGEDEVIVSDDFPEGKTRGIVEGMAVRDSRIIYIEGPRKGVIKNFEYAIGCSKGDYIFLADQDDVWLDGKVSAVTAELKNGADVVLHDAIITDSELKPTGETAFKINRVRKGVLANVIKNSYQGSCMAFKSDMKRFILPFPDKLPMHDQWIGLMGEKHGEVRLLNHPYIYYRRHSENVSGNGSSFFQKIKWRIDIIGCLLRK